jgi:hypothetical protein
MAFLENVDPLAVNAIIAVVVVTLLDFVTGVLRAIADRTFEWAALDVWVRTQLLGRVVPIVLIVGAGQVLGGITVGDPANGGVSLDLLGVGGMLAAVTVVASGVKSIIDNLNRFLPITTTEHTVPIE